MTSTEVVVITPDEDPLRHRFTDEDVRKNPNLVQIAERYLWSYEGDFDFLRKMRRTVKCGESLTVGMVRGVLNCMRHDSTVVAALRTAQMNPPLPPDITGIAPVIPISGRLGSASFVQIACNLRDGHRAHEWYDDSSDRPFLCPGVSFEINRPRYYKRPASVADKYTYVRARTGKKVHALAGGAYIEWYPVFHDVGFTQPPMLVVYTNCKYPSEIRKPVLLERRLTPHELHVLGGLVECTTCIPGDET